MISSDRTYKPKVSIIIPVYNVRQYIEEALDSVINQTYKNLEIIVINDGSNDGSEIICDEYAKKDNRIKLIHQKNSGLSAARNVGLDNMTGEYVAFLDSDDVFIPETIEKSLSALLTNDTDCVVFKRIACKTMKNGKLKKLSKETILPKVAEGLYPKEEILKKIADRKMNFAVWNKLSKREIWDNLRFPEGTVFEDLYIVFEMFCKTKKIFVIDDVLVLYRLRTGSITMTASIKNIEDLTKSWSVFYDFIEKHTPEIFDEDQLKKTRKIQFHYLIIDYAKILSLHSTEKDKILSLMKENIRSYECTINIKECSATTRLVYFMMYNHPELLSIFFPFCYKFYKKIKQYNIKFFKKEFC